jgi:RimJ/RimL family protein N-acetyltransferase
MTTELDLDSMADPRIEGDRIYLRRLSAIDVSATYLGWMTAPTVNRYLESRFAEHTLQGLHDFVEKMAGDPLNLFAGIFLRDGDVHIGNIKLGPIDARHRRADIGLLIGDPECWGKGYATEAIAVLSDFAFARVGLHRLTAGAYAENEGSARAFERAGFAREGLLRSHWFCEGKFQDGVYLGRINPSESDVYTKAEAR